VAHYIFQKFLTVYCWRFRSILSKEISERGRERGIKKDE
jgi:hypothetical protein